MQHVTTTVVVKNQEKELVQESKLNMMWRINMAIDQHQSSSGASKELYLLRQAAYATGLLPWWGSLKSKPKLKSYKK
jgi:hypothetical protein